MDAAELVVKYDLGRVRWYRPTLDELVTQASSDVWLRSFAWSAFQAGPVGTVVGWDSDIPAMTTRDDLRGWFESAPEGATHMVVALDEIDGGCFPIYVGQAEDARRRAKQENEKPLQRVMEVYRLDYSFDKQVAEYRCFTYDHPEAEKDGGASGQSPIDATDAREPGFASKGPAASLPPAPGAPPSPFAELSLQGQCAEHGQVVEAWIVCVHTEDIRTARLVMEQPTIVGEAVCDECRRALGRGKPPVSSLRIACGLCAKDRWPLEGAS